MWGWSYRKEPIMANKKTAIKILKKINEEDFE